MENTVIRSLASFMRTRLDEEGEAATTGNLRALRWVIVLRALTDDLLEEKHLVVTDCWYTCAAATEEREGETTCNDDVRGGPCDCGRDGSVAHRLRLLADIWCDHPDYQSKWDSRDRTSIPGSSENPS
jgi:hypothetical protein